MTRRPDEDSEFFNEADAETVATIKDLIETRVRPAVANDGGDITFRGFKDGVVYLNMKGSCAGCPSSTATLQHGIQNLLKHFVPTWSKSGRCERKRMASSEWRIETEIDNLFAIRYSPSSTPPARCRRLPRRRAACRRTFRWLPRSVAERPRPSTSRIR
jgi:Fe-S cluster biogenesis protein NfuA